MDTKYIQILPTNINIIQSFNGHTNIKGRGSNKIFNNYYLVNEVDNSELKFYLILCNKNSYTYISLNNLEYVFNIDNIKPTWFKLLNCYIACHVHDKILYLHQHIMNKYFVKENDILSIDHINRNKLDNRTTNLRYTNQSVQNKNTEKRLRKINARQLPENIKELSKFVTYNVEVINKNTNKCRDFFRIEKHPNLTKTWSSSKSTNINILDKYHQTLNQLKLIDEQQSIMDKKDLVNYESININNDIINTRDCYYCKLNKDIKLFIYNKNNSYYNNCIDCRNKMNLRRKESKILKSQKK